MSLNPGSIDPRTLKELLRLQMLSKSDLLSSPGGTTGEEGNSDFSELLGGLLAMKDQQDIPPAPSLKPTLMSMPGLMSMNPLVQERLSASKPTEYETLIQEASRRFGVESSLVKAVIDAESSFNPNAVSRAGAKGLMQLMDATGQGLGVTNPFDPVQNIEGGTRYLSNLLVKYNGNASTALAAYNAGPGRVDRLGIKNDAELMAKLHLLPGETQQYVSKVMRLKQDYEPIV
ncbi:MULTISPECIES: lytic transglycosylase domain-containing protein [unclassified Paenibacillus]|uniref:lytic transglycosylase domain-containing protein n=1 Tax=unclassified Paenibacillus TaxID=185978 RepID=UPI001AEA0249|nr:MULTISPECIES: lytic transglycosylase domain-containing protein [unclassified Paenibacillus]MBP1156309.1 soluble lytic murein transglycosylase-like protein [Paenibacillus sp. PvP091]MBP1168305.1 soluble lytic murein transglycosylase-like protein [Paenibacillus sp. PvR098]MBP2439333.1 soluble lytic murein transglycosylase-like protein [Paenibacillus sp. PvP052]